MLAAVLGHPQGGAKGLPPGARLVPWLNKADLPGLQAAGREVARGLLRNAAVDEVLIAAAETDEPVREAWGRVAAVVLAAGQGRRFGGLKQVMPWHGEPLVAHVAEQALACPDVATVVVTAGAGIGQVTAALGVTGGEQPADCDADARLGARARAAARAAGLRAAQAADDLACRPRCSCWPTNPAFRPNCCPR